jgi:hypothetical protein
VSPSVAPRSAASTCSPLATGGSTRSMRSASTPKAADPSSSVTTYVTGMSWPMRKPADVGAATAATWKASEPAAL